MFPLLSTTVAPSEKATDFRCGRADSCTNEIHVSALQCFEPLSQRIRRTISAILTTSDVRIILRQMTGNINVNGVNPVRGSTDSCGSAGFVNQSESFSLFATSKHHSCPSLYRWHSVQLCCDHGGSSHYPPECASYFGANPWLLWRSMTGQPSGQRP